MKDLEKGPSDDKWRWIVLPVSFLTMVMHVSINYNCGVLNDAILETYPTDAVQSSWLMSYYCALFALGAPFASAAILLTDCRTIVIISGVLGLAGFASSSLVRSMPVLYVTLGLSGFAMSLSQTASMLTLSYYFPDNLPLVHGVCLAGSGMGSFIHPVLTQAFLDMYGFYGTMLILGGMSFHSTCFGMLLRPSHVEIKSKEFLTRRQQNKWKIIRSKIIPPADIIKIPAYVALIPCVFFYSMAIQSMVVILPSYIKRYVGLSIQQGSVAAMVLGAGSVSSRLFAGVAASDENIREFLLYVGMSGLLSVLSFGGKVVMNMHHGVYVFSFFYGLYGGGLLSLANTMMMGIVGIELSAHGYGLLMFMFGIAGFVGPPFLSLLVEVYGPDMLFLSSGVICALSSILALITNHLRKFPNDATSAKDLTAVRDMSIYVFDDQDDREGGEKHDNPYSTSTENLREFDEDADAADVAAVVQGYRFAPEGDTSKRKRIPYEPSDSDHLVPVTNSSPAIEDDAQTSLLRT